jgi:hypothetical protein
VKELNMKRLLGLLLVMGMVGCGGGDTSPNHSQAKVDEPPVQTVDVSKLVERDGLLYEGDSETPFTGVAVEKHENGQKSLEATLKNGKADGPSTMWRENGKKRAEAIWKDGELVSLKNWDDEGNESNY